MKRAIWVLLLSLLCTGSLMAQSIVVKGIVTDKSNGELLPGANVVVEGTTTGTTTNFDGEYTIEVPSSNATLVFSFMGMKTTAIAVNGNNTINATLDYDSEVLDDVIIVAYGTTTKEGYTGAAEVVDSEMIEDRPVSSFTKALQGTTSGLQVTSSSGQPGTSATVRIRGIGSLSAGSSPLYVLDGVPYSGSLSDMNPNDIESLTVLKDAAATSLYGSRAANGVILINTKQGKTGQTQISFNAQYGVSSRISDGYALMNSTQIYEQSWMGLYNQQLLNGNTTSEAISYAHGNVEDIVGFNPFGIDNPLDDNGKVIPGTKVLTNTDWRDEVYKTGIIQNYNLNVSGGTEATKVFFSLGYFSDSGTTLSSDFKRYTAKLNASQKVNDFIDAGMFTHFSFSETNAPPSGGGGANPVRSAEIMNSATPVYNNDGTYNWDNTAARDFNPVGLAELDKYEYKTNSALVNTYVNFQILPSLTFRTNAGVDYSASKGLNYYNPYHGNGAGVNGRATQSRSDNLGWNISNIFTWSKAFENSNLEILAGQEAHSEEFSVLSAGVTDFSVPGYTDLVWGGTPTTPSSYTSGWTMASFLGQAKYNHAGKYYFSTSFRRDGSSRFGLNNKWGSFYSVGSSWRISNEDFMDNVDWVNNLKLRASYGTSGNNTIGNYASLGLYGSGSNYGGYPGITPVQPENRDLSWEKIASTNIGLETRLFNQISFDFEYYNRQSDGLLFSKPLSAGKGFGAILTNLGAMTNSGFEGSLEWDAVTKENFNYTVGFNISTNKNVIDNLDQESIKSGSKILEVGGDVYQFYLKEWAGVNPENGTPMWYVNEVSDDFEESRTVESAYTNPLGGDREVTSDYSDAERVRMGSALPDFYGGLTNRITYKDFDLNFYFYYSLGGQVYNYDYAGNMHDGTQPGYNLAVDAANAWTPNNKFTNVPRYIVSGGDEGNQLSSRFLEDASYLRLKNISLAYNLPKNILEKFKMDTFKLSVSGENLWTLTDYKGFDPEGSLSGTTNNSIPGVKVVNVGLKINF
jgi:TonB-linked SusC/RagA family outer membrane protein